LQTEKAEQDYLFGFFYWSYFIGIKNYKSMFNH